MLLHRINKIINGQCILVKDGEIDNLKVGDTENIIFEFVDGNKVRDKIDVNFTMGGHHYVYDYIPENEIWIEQDQIEEDIMATMIHEITERMIMKYLNKKYDFTHENFANPVEETFRKVYQKYLKEDEE